jgi:hypothetical protein
METALKIGNKIKDDLHSKAERVLQKVKLYVQEFTTRENSFIGQANEL